MDLKPKGIKVNPSNFNLVKSFEYHSSGSVSEAPWDCEDCMVKKRCTMLRGCSLYVLCLFMPALVFTTELHGDLHNSAGAARRCIVGGDLAVLYPTQDFLIYFAMFSFLYRGFAVVVFLPALTRCLTKSLSAVPSLAMVRRNPKKTTGSANHIA